MTKPAIYNIPGGICFADALAAGILKMAAGNPLALADYLVLVPSRRAARTLRDAFLRLSEGKPVLLPRLQPLGDVDAEEVSMMLAGDGNDAIDVPPAISKLERQILLARLVQKMGSAESFDQAAALALELGRFLDDAQNERLPFDALATLVPDEFAGHWQKTLEFLKVLTHHWPLILAERGLTDPAVRRNALIAQQIRAWADHPPQHPVIAAGSAGTTPAARELIAAVAHLPQGMVVLPALDTDLDDKSWDAVAPDHPQFNMKRLLASLGVTRADVQPFALPDHLTPSTARARLFSEVMRPPETTEQWRHLTERDIPPAAVQNLSRIDCATPQEEAEVIALILRETLETPGKTAALITPDRRLARRVTLALRRWGIQIDDSGGQPLTESIAGTWLLLTAEIAEENLAPVTLLSVLKHPIMAAQMPPEELRAMIYLLDALVLRGPRPAPGLQGLMQAIDDLPDALEGSKQKLKHWLQKITPYLENFIARMSDGETSFRALIESHIAMAESLANTLDKPGPERLWMAEAGEAASEFLYDLIAAAGDIPALQPRQYVALLRNMLKGVTVRPSHGSHPRLFILGQIEARLYCADRVVIGSLNEGTWPALPALDPWMSRSMRAKFGLPSPEEDIGLAAHDFMQAATAAEVFMTRAKKVDGTPTVPARWLLRLDAVLKAAGLDLPPAEGAKFLQWRKDMDLPGEIRPIQRPAPTPPVESRPRRMRVTKIDTWLRDPYQIYAEYILKLKALDPIDADAGGAERGTFIHEALDLFIKAYPDDLPPDAVEKLLAFGRQALIDMRIVPEVEAFWWPRFMRVAEIFIQQEKEWRQIARPFATEAAGEWAFEVKGNPFTLSGKADRIDKLPDGYAVIDYKSGYTPTKSEVRQGLSPQLPLEAVMLEKGAFPDIPAGASADLVYWRVTGSGKKPVERIALADDDHPIKDLVAAAEAGLKNLVAHFDDAGAAYLSQPNPEIKPAFSDYDHLARVREWGLSGDDGEGEA